MNYPDVKAIVSGFFAPLDKSRCLVCGKELRNGDTTCGKPCFSRMCEIQRGYSEDRCNQMIETARTNNDPRLIA